MGTLAGKKWLPRDVAALLYEHGWTGFDNQVDFVATVGGESAYYEEAEGDPHPDGTIDLGLFQLNSLHAPGWGMSFEEFKAMAFDPHKAVVYARKLWDAAAHQGDPFKPWYAYSNDSYKRYMRQAIVGCANAKAIREGLQPAVRWGK